MLEQIKNIDIVEVARRLGLEVSDANGQCLTRCPVGDHEHDDSNPACSLGGDQPHLFHCFKCQAAGNAIHLVEAIHKCKNQEAIDWLRTEGFLPSEEDAPELPADPIERLAQIRGWKPDALRVLGAEAVDDEVQIPMRDAKGNVIGNRRRRADNKPFQAGAKALSVKGSKNGIICPWPIPKSEQVLVCEGEMDAAAAISAGVSAVIATPGAQPGKATRRYIVDLLKGRTAVLAPDPDGAGSGWRDTLKRDLQAAEIPVQLIAALSDEGDLDKRLKTGADINELIKTAITVDPPVPKEPSAASKLLDLVEGFRFIHTPDNTAYAIPPNGGRPLRLEEQGSRFASWLRYRYLTEEGQPARSGDVSDVVRALIGKALNEGDKREAHVRVAGHEGKIYLDLGREDSKAVEITSQGWGVIDSPPVIFAKGEALALLTIPDESAGVADLGTLIDLLGLTPENAYLVTAWLLGALKPDTPFPILVLTGAAGSGKSTRTRMLRYLVDPAAQGGMLVSSPPKEPRDLFASASGLHVVAIDNLSAVPQWMSDILSSLATGAGQMLRKLYTDAGSYIVQARRPIILNGIGIGGLGADLMDRAIVIDCPPLNQLQQEAELLRRLREAAPKILTALLDCCVVALKNQGNVQIPVNNRPRMYDFAYWVVAAESELRKVKHWRNMDFLALYSANRNSASDEMIESDPLSKMLFDLVDIHNQWRGTASDLLAALDALIEEKHGLDKAGKIRFSKEWPESASVLGTRLKRLVPTFREVGVDIHQERIGKSGKREWVINRLADSADRADSVDSSAETGSADSADSADSVFPPYTLSLGQDNKGKNREIEAENRAKTDSSVMYSIGNSPSAPSALSAPSAGAPAGDTQGADSLSAEPDRCQPLSAKGASERSVENTSDIDDFLSEMGYESEDQ